MVKRPRVFLATSAFLFVLAFGVTGALTEEGSTGEYVIKKGDTLWDISSEKLKDPLLWPKIWRVNPRIRNPHLIYPGHTLEIPGEGMAEEPAPPPAPVARKEIKLQKLPRVQLPVVKARYLISERGLLSSGVIAGGLSPVGHISESPKQRRLMGVDEFVYITSYGSLAPKTLLYVLTKPEKVHHPVTGEFFGYKIRVKGIIEFLGMENGYQKARIRESFEEVLPHDPLVPYYAVEAPVEPMHPNRPGVAGVVLTASRERNMTGPDGVVYLDRGASDGLVVGDMFTVFSGEPPHAPIGDIQVIHVPGRSAVAIVKASEREIIAGDYFKN
jgi:LysM domain